MFKEPLDIDIETIADDFQIDALAKTIFMESAEVGVDAGSLHDGAFHLLGGYPANPGYSFIGLLGTNFALPIQSVDLFPVSPGKGAQELVAHIPHADRAVEITEDKVFHGIFRRVG